MGDPLPDASTGLGRDGGPDALLERLTRLLSGALDVWGSSGERRRMRVYGFRPAVEPGVLKREWHGLRVRVRPDLLVATDPDGSTLSYSSDERIVRIDGEPFVTTPASIAVAERLVALIDDYERWVEAREGRDARLARARATSRDTRPVNALAETRRIRRILAATRGRRR